MITQKTENLKKTRKVGYCSPPAAPFSKTNQPKKNGRPKGSLSMRTVLKKILNQEIDFDDPLLGKKVRKPVHELIALKLVALGISGNMDAIREINNRIDGKLKSIEINVGENNLNVATKNIIIVRSPNAKPLRPIEAVDVERSSL